jgi:hypothetical protein
MNVTFQSYKVWFSRIAKLVLTATSVGFWVHPTYLMFFFNPQTYVGAPSRRWEWNDWISHTGTYKATFDHGIESSESDESGYLTVCHGNHNLLIGKTSTNGPFSSIFHGYVSHNQRVDTSYISDTTRWEKKRAKSTRKTKKKKPSQRWITAEVGEVHSKIGTVNDLQIENSGI